MKKFEVPEREVILNFIELGRGNVDAKKQLAKQLGISFEILKYRVKKFTKGEGIGRKKRSDSGIPKKEPGLKTKLAFFAELAMGVSVDEATRKLCVKEHIGNRLAKEFIKHDKWKAIRNAPQLDDLRELVKDILRLDIAIVDAEMHGAFKIEVSGTTISIPVAELNDIKIILAHCLQRDEMGRIDPAYEGLAKEDLEKVRVQYLKEYFLEKKNAVDYSRLARSTKVNTPERQLDLQVAYGIIDELKPGLDENSKIKILRSIIAKVKS